MIYVLYHGVDHDGHTAGAVVRWYLESGYQYQLGRDFQMVALDYGMDWDVSKLTSDDKVYMVDYTLQPYEKTIEVHKKCQLMVIDHHKTNEAILREAGVQGTYGPAKHAACRLTWDVLIGTKVPRTIQLLSDYDNWNDQDKEYWNTQVLPFHYGMGVVKTDPQDPKAWAMWESIFRSLPHQEEVFVKQQLANGELIMKYQDTQNESAMQDSFDLVFEGVRFIVVNGGRGSNAFKSTYNPQVHEAMMAFRLHKNRYWTVSMYAMSDKSIDLSPIAKKWGGGGHAKACGFQVDDITKVIGKTRKQGFLKFASATLMTCPSCNAQVSYDPTKLEEPVITCPKCNVPVCLVQI